MVELLMELQPKKRHLAPTILLGCLTYMLENVVMTSQIPDDAIEHLAYVRDHYLIVLHM